MTRIIDRDSNWAIIMLEGIMLRHRKDGDVLNDKAFDHIKNARDILKSINHNPNQQNGHSNGHKSTGD